MKKASLNGENSPQIIRRILQLQPGNSPLWGSFSVSGMMFHCITIHHSILSNRDNRQKPTLKQRIMTTFVLQMMKRLPKGIKTNPQYLQPKEDITSFEENKSRLIESIQSFAKRNENIYGTHPLLGPLNTKQWRRFVYMHLDHHLRQFGV